MANIAPELVASAGRLVNNFNMKSSQNHFDIIAEEYDRTLPEHVQRHYLRKRVRLIGRLLSGGKALDVGCGTGRLMEALRPYGEITGVDGSPGMIAVLKREGRGEAVVAPTDALPFAAGTFDVVFCVAVLHHVAAPEGVRGTIREMARVAKPGGWLVIWDHNPDNPYWPHLMARCPQDTGEERLIPERELREALASAGIKEIRIRKSGFVPDFMPKWLIPLARVGETVFERLPLLRRFAAHNVIIARKAR